MAFEDEVQRAVDDIVFFTKAVYQQAAQSLVEDMLTPVGHGGNMPVDTGFLRSSLVASLKGMPQILETARPVPGRTYGNPAVGAVIAQMELGDTLYLGFTAVYALRQNYGFTGTDSLGRYYSQGGRLFVERAAQKWDRFVEEAVALGLSTLGADNAPPP